MICCSDNGFCYLSLESVDLCYIGQLNYWPMTLNLNEACLGAFLESVDLG